MSISSFVRNDFRRLHENRAITIENNVVHEADASASINIGNTSVIVSLYGPMQSKQSKFEQYDQLSIGIEFNRNQQHLVSNFTNITNYSKNKVPSNENSDDIENQHINNVELNNSVIYTASTQITKYKENQIRKNIKELISNCVNIYEYPKLLLVVRVIIIRNDGALESAIYNACSSALMSCHLSMKCIPITMSCALITIPSKLESAQSNETQTQFALDPTIEEELPSLGSVLFTYGYSNQSSKEYGLLHTQYIGNINEDFNSKLTTLIEKTKFCDDLYVYMTKNLIKS